MHLVQAACSQQPHVRAALPRHLRFQVYLCLQVHLRFKVYTRIRDLKELPRATLVWAMLEEIERQCMAYGSQTQ